MEKEILINNQDEMIALGYNIGKYLKPNMVLALEGDLGAGKTTMTKGIAKALEITEIINSPTFTIMKIHKGKLTLYHMDVYRLENSNSDDDLEEYLYLDGVTVIEWASIYPSILPKHYMLITIKNLEDSKRLVTLSSDSLEYDDIIRGL